MVRDISKCETCSHLRVCNYSESRRELTDTLNKTLTNWCGTDYFLPEFFVITLECREWNKQESTKRDIKERCFA